MTTEVLRVRPNETMGDCVYDATGHPLPESQALRRTIPMAVNYGQVATVLVWESGTAQALPFHRQTALELEFDHLADEWHRETIGLSLISRKCSHPAYQQIIGMGKPVIPLILRELKRRPDHWFWALRALTRENPVQEQDAGRMDRMADAWLNWGRLHNYPGV